MSQAENVSATERVPLSGERVLRGAVAVADAGGIGSLRSLAQHLGVKPMSLYYYVAGKDEILDGIVDLVFSEIELPSVIGAPRWYGARTRPVEP
jgi:AcrR family transcriptional regulator